MSFSSKSQSHSSYGIAGVVPGSFLTAGPGVNPTVFDGAIIAVEQLDDSLAGSSFHRVTLDAEFLATTHAKVAHAELLANEDITTAIGSFVADGPGGGPFPAKTNAQIDIVIKSGGVDNVVAGRRVNLILIARRAGAR